MLLRLGMAIAFHEADSLGLTQSTRARIYETIRSEPGALAARIAARHGLSLNTVKYHIRILERGRLIHGIGPGRRRWYVLGPRLNPTPVATASAGRIYACLQQSGSTEQGAIAAKLDLAPSTVSAAVRILREAGLVDTVRVGRRSLIGLRSSRPAIEALRA